MVVTASAIVTGLIAGVSRRQAEAEAAAPLSWIGEVSAGSGLVVLGAALPVPGLSGYEHP